jgi:hypothetical protein
MCYPIACELLRLRSRSREAETNASDVLRSSLLACLRAHPKSRRLSEDPTAEQAILVFAGLGGHLKHDGPPAGKPLQPVTWSCSPSSAGFWLPWLCAGDRTRRLNALLGRGKPRGAHGADRWRREPMYNRAGGTAVKAKLVADVSSAALAHHRPMPSLAVQPMREEARRRAPRGLPRPRRAAESLQRPASDVIKGQSSASAC